jgi:hypothetical protein
MLHRNILSVSCSIISLNLKKRQKNLIKDPSPDIKHSRKNKGEGLMDSGHFASFTIDFGYIICLERSIPELLSLLPNVDCLITSWINWPIWGSWELGWKNCSDSSSLGEASFLHWLLPHVNYQPRAPYIPSLPSWNPNAWCWGSRHLDGIWIAVHIFPASEWQHMLKRNSWKSNRKMEKRH